MTAVVDFHRLAAADFRDARRWYAGRSRVAEGRFVAAVQEAVDRIATDPAGGSPSLVSPARWVRVRRFPYTLHFRPLGPGWVEVLAVAHDKRRPGYWLRRTQSPYYNTINSQESKLIII